MRLRTTLIKNFPALIQATLLVAMALSVGACAEWLPDAHRLDLQQGNTIKLEQVKQLEIGMSKEEVRKILGSPMLADPFHNQRWDYIYRFIPGRGFERKSRLTLFFSDDILQRIDDSEYVEP